MNIDQILNRASSSDSDDSKKKKKKSKKKEKEKSGNNNNNKGKKQQQQQEQTSNEASTSGTSSSSKQQQQQQTNKKRVKAPNSTWTIEDDAKLVDLVMSTLPRQDFTEYARILNKRDSQTVRYRWKVIVRRAKGSDNNND